LWIGAKPVFADCNEHNLNISVDHVRQLITDKTRAIVCVHYGGLACDMKGLADLSRKHFIPLIEDCAQALGTRYKGNLIGQGNFSCFSFQAIKHITTGDGGMLTTAFKIDADKAKRLRWFGIDREAKQNGIWENDITEIGYKYQMTDISATMGIEGLKDFDWALDHRKRLHNRYEELLGKSVIGCGDSGNSAWMCTILCTERKKLQEKLRANRIESGVVHYRNDQYSVFGGKKCEFPNMDYMEDKYMVLPLHTHMGLTQVDEICSVINEGWY
jgi:dTDP-4-amino-4,6-dideoxygalactose transaminase